MDDQLSPTSFQESTGRLSANYIIDVDPALLGELAALPHRHTHEFALRIREWLSESRTAVAVLLVVARDRSLVNDVRFAAAYGAMITLWRCRDFTQFAHLCDEFSSEFSTEPLFDVFRAESELARGSRLGNLRSALVYARTAQEALPQLPGVLHLYAELVARVCERTLDTDIDTEEVARAETAVRRAIFLTKGAYAKYHATLARIDILQARYDSARDSIQAAMDAEDTSTVESAARLSGYEVIAERITLAQAAELQRLERDQVRQELSKAQAQSITLVGILAAAIAFIVTTSSLASTLSGATLQFSLIGLGGMLIMVFSSFSFAFGILPCRRFVVLLLGGLFMLVTSCVLTILLGA